ncbi:MAG TPA: sodium ion-translocating decarboxylase subunit beta [Rhodothermales bacterium]
MFDMLIDFLGESGFGQFHWSNGVMLLIGLLFIYLAVKKGFEPMLLIPIGFGMLLGNIPYDTSKLSVGVYDGPVSEEDLAYYASENGTWIDSTYFGPWELIYTPTEEEQARNRVSHQPYLFQDRVSKGEAVMVNASAKLYHPTTVTEPGVIQLHQGRKVLAIEQAPDDRYPIVVSPEGQNPWKAGIFWMLFRGVEWGFYPPLIFLGIGALTDFGPLLANPRSILLGAAAQLGIFGALTAAILFGFTPAEAGSIGIIGGADGPTAIFVATKLAPDLLGAIALSAYSYMALVPIIQPPIMKLLTTREERLIRMEAPKEASRTLRIAFPILAFILTAFIANGALPLLGMLFFGNLLRESLVTERLAKTASTAFIDIITILLGLTVGAKTQASTFLTPQTLYIFVLGVVAFSVSTAGGVLFGKIMNRLSKTPVNPLIGAAGVSAVPMSARVVQKVANQEDPQNYLLMQAMGPNVAGVIGSAIAAGVLISYLS